MKKDLFDHPKNIRRIIQALTICCAVLFFLDAVIHRHTDHPWETLFGFYAIYGFISCVILVLLAKELRKLIMRSERFYSSEEEPSDNE